MILGDKNMIESLWKRGSEDQAKKKAGGGKRTLWEDTEGSSPMLKITRRSGGRLKSHHGDEFVRKANNYTLM